MKNFFSRAKDLVDLEIVIPGPESSAAMGPVREGYMDISEPVDPMTTRKGPYTKKELREMPIQDLRFLRDLQKLADTSPFDAEQVRKDAELLASVHAEPREPWYKRLWNWVTK